MSDFVKITEQGPALDTKALANAGKALIGAESASKPVATPVVRSAPVVQSNIEVTPGIEQPKAVDPSVLPSVAAQNPSILQQEATPQQVETPAVEAAPKYVNVPDHELVELTIDGEKRVVTMGEAKKQMMLHSKFTKEMQSLRQREEQFEQRAAQLQQIQAEAEQAQKLRMLISQPQLYVRYMQADPVRAMQLAEAFGVSPEQALSGTTGIAAAPVRQSTPFEAPRAPFGGNAEEIVNFGELESALAQRTSALEQRFGQTLEQRLMQVDQAIQERVAAAVTEIEDRRSVNQLQMGIQQEIEKVLTTKPQLKALPYVQDLIQFEVRRLRPKTVAELNEAIQVVASAIAEPLDAAYNQQRQTQVVAKAKLETEGIEPGKGALAPNTTVKPQVSMKQLGDVNHPDYWKRLRELGRASLS